MKKKNKTIEFQKQIKFALVTMHLYSQSEINIENEGRISLKRVCTVSNYEICQWNGMSEGMSMENVFFWTFDDFFFNETFLLNHLRVPEFLLFLTKNIFICTALSLGAINTSPCTIHNFNVSLKSVYIKKMHFFYCTKN